MTRPVDFDIAPAASAEQAGWRDVDAVDIGRLFAMVTARKWWVIGSVVAALVVAVVYLNLAKYTYTVEYQVTPTDSNTQSLLGNLGGLASLAGVNLPGKNDASPFSLYLEALRTRGVAEEAARDPLILQGAFPKDWDDAAGRWRKPDSAVGAIADAVKSTLGLPVYAWRAPDAAALQKFIGDNVTIAEIPKKSLASISIEHESPAFATRLLAAIHRAGDEQLRRRSLTRSTAYIDYIARQLPLVSIAEQRAALSRVLSDQEKQRMIASAGVPFAADPFSPITVSPRPTWPKPILILAIALIGGLFVGVALAAVLGWRDLRLATRRSEASK
jgi:uncharacterized protein involved in exopolysaccharide biosynthesis